MKHINVIPETNCRLSKQVKSPFKRIVKIYVVRQYILFLVVCSTIMQFSCKQPINESYRVIGHELSLSDQMLYFLDTYSGNVLDSTLIIDGHFDLSIEKEKVPSRLLSIRYYDKEREQAEILAFPVGDDRKTFHTWFFVEDERTVLEDFKEIEPKGTHARYFAKIAEVGYENSLVQQFPFFDLSNSVGYDQQLEDYGRAIAQYADSKFLVGCLFKNRTAFSRVDLNGLFGLFSTDAKASFYGRLLSSFLDADVHPSSFSLTNERVGLVQNFDKRTMLNVLVFHSREVRPFLPAHATVDSLIDLYEGNRQVFFSHALVDQNPLDWKSLLQNNRPSWPQFSVDKAYNSFLSFKYNFQGIPLVIFTDEYGRILRKVEGYHQETVTDYVSYINEVLRPDE